MTTASPRPAQATSTQANDPQPPLPHHDGSTLYVSNPCPNLGDTIRVRVRIPRTAPYTAVVLHSLADDELHLENARPILSTDTETWYEAPLPIHNPDTRYRFALLRDGGFDWLNALGVFNREVATSSIFASPPSPHRLHGTEKAPHTKSSPTASPDPSNPLHGRHPIGRIRPHGRPNRSPTVLKPAASGTAAI